MFIAGLPDDRARSLPWGRHFGALPGLGVAPDNLIRADTLMRSPRPAFVGQVCWLLVFSSLPAGLFPIAGRMTKANPGSRPHRLI